MYICEKPLDFEEILILAQGIGWPMLPLPDMEEQISTRGLMQSECHTSTDLHMLNATLSHSLA